MNKNRRSSSVFILLSALAVACMFLLINFYFYLFPTNDENKELFEKIKSRNIRSLVVRKSIDYSNHGATYVIYEKDSLPIHSDWEEKIEMGDSIIKPLESLKLIIKNPLKIDTLDYEKQKEVRLTTNF